MLYLNVGFPHYLNHSHHTLPRPIHMHTTNQPHNPPALNTPTYTHSKPLHPTPHPDTPQTDTILLNLDACLICSPNFNLKMHHNAKRCYLHLNIAEMARKLHN